jgi:hypothetical protein
MQASEQVEMCGWLGLRATDGVSQAAEIGLRMAKGRAGTPGTGGSAQAAAQYLLKTSFAAALTHARIVP